EVYRKCIAGNIAVFLDAAILSIFRELKTDGGLPFNRHQTVNIPVLCKDPTVALAVTILAVQLQCPGSRLPSKVVGKTQDVREIYITALVLLDTLSLLLEIALNFCIHGIGQGDIIPRFRQALFCILPDNTSTFIGYNAGVSVTAGVNGNICRGNDNGTSKD